MGRVLTLDKEFGIKSEAVENNMGET